MTKGFTSGAAAFAGVVFGAVALQAGEVIYRNDFSTRESSRPIPEYGVWHEAQPYPSVQSDIAFTPSSLTGDYVANDPRFAWRGTYYAQAVGDGNDRPNYDGWVTPFHIRRTKYKAHPQIRFDGENPVFAWYNSDAVRTNQGFVVQSIHNAFTRGILRVQVDMRPPEDWSVVPDAYHTCFVFPVYGTYMDPLALGGSGEECMKIDGTSAPNITPGFFGFTSGYTSKKAHTTKTTFLRSYYIDPSTGKLANKNIGNSYSTTATAARPSWRTLQPIRTRRPSCMN